MMINTQITHLWVSVSFLTDASPADRVRMDSGEERALEAGWLGVGSKVRKKTKKKTYQPRKQEENVGCRVLYEKCK